MYIATGAGAAQYLTDDMIKDVIQRMKGPLRSKEYGEAVRLAVVDIGLRVAGAANKALSWQA